MRRLICIFLIACFISCGNKSGNKNDKNTIQSEIKTTKTDKHIHVAGSRLFIVPPPGFKPIGTMVGLQKESGAQIIIMDLVGGNFYTNAATTSGEAYEKAGAKVFDYKEITINGFPAKYIYMENAEKMRAYNLVFGDSSFSTMIMAMYPASDAQTGKEILQSLQTIWYDKSVTVDPFAIAHFRIDDSVSKFRFQQFNASMYLYTVDGKKLDTAVDNSMLIIAQIPRQENMTGENIAEMMLAKAQQYGFADPQVKDISKEPINGSETVEAETHGMLKDKKAVFYYCIITKGDKQLIITGVAKNNTEEDVAEFKKLTHTIIMK
jgi:hypothetical protein